MCNDIHAACSQPSSNPGQRALPLTLMNNTDTDAAVRSFRISLVSGKIRGDLHPGDDSGGPWSVSNLFSANRTHNVHIVDDDGPTRFSLEPTVASSSSAVSYSRKEFGSSSDLWLPVFRAGGGNGTTPSVASVDSELVPSGEHPATPGPTSGTDTDYTDLTNGTVSFPAIWTNPNPDGGDTDTGPRLSWIKIRIKNDPFKEENETFDVVLTAPNNPGGANSTTVTIENDLTDGEPPGERLHPLGKLHHPKLNYKYPRNYPYLNEIHLFTKNAKKLRYPREFTCPGPEEYCDWRVIVAELAIRKRFKGGKCVWWTGNRFEERGRSNQRWFRMKRGGGEDYFLYRIKDHSPRASASPTFGTTRRGVAGSMLRQTCRPSVRGRT